REDQIAPVAVSPRAADGAAAFAGQGVEQEIADIDACVRAVVRERTERAVVAGVIAVGAVAHEVEAELQDMRTLQVGVVGLELELVVAGVGDGGRRTEAGQTAAPVEARETGVEFSAGNADLQVPVRAELPGPVDHFV